MTTDPTGFTQTSSQSVTLSFSTQILTKAAVKLTKVTLLANCTATRVRVFAADKTTVLATSSTSSQEATFDLSLADATTYYVVAGSAGSSFTSVYDSTPGFVVSGGTNVNYVAMNSCTDDGDEITGADDTSFGMDIVSLDTEIPSTTVTPDAQVLTLALGTPTVLKSWTATPSALTLSLTGEGPLYLLQIPSLSLSNGLTLATPTLDGMNIRYTTGQITFPLAAQTSGEAGIATKYPNAEGLNAAYEKQTGRVTNLVTQNYSVVPKKNRVGL